MKQNPPHPSSSSFRRVTVQHHNMEDRHYEEPYPKEINSLELCYQYLRQSDLNHNGILSPDEYMAFVHRLTSSLQQYLPSRYNDSTRRNTEEVHATTSTDTKTRIIDSSDNTSSNFSTINPSLESIMVFNHLSHQTTTSQPEVLLKQKKEPTKDSRSSSSCTSNSYGEVDCSDKLSSNDSNITSIWLGTDHSPKAARRLRHAKEPKRIDDKMELLQLICDEVLIAMDLHTSQSRNFSKYSSGM